MSGIDVKYLSGNNFEPNHDLTEHHRDDHYIMAIMLKGSGIIQCDMVQLHAKPASIMIMKPYQIHAIPKSKSYWEGYAISFAPFLIPDRCHAIFQNLNVKQQVLKMPKNQKSNIISTTALLQDAFMEKNVFRTFIVNGLFNSLINRIASLYSNAESNTDKLKNQPQLIAARFKQLLSVHSFLQKPSFFADALHISTAHLNDSVKSSTGFSVTYWLQNALTLEAKRHLYYTNNDVKEIAFDLGFEDHTYFSRLFKKLTTETPVAFRKKFRE